VGVRLGVSGADFFFVYRWEFDWVEVGLIFVVFCFFVYRWEFDWVYVGLRALASVGLVWDIKVQPCPTPQL
jgi:hypothetical protein